MMFVFYACAFGLNTVAVKTIELSVAYAIWSGVGTALTGAIGILYFKEPATAIKMVSLTLIIVGVMGLQSASVAMRIQRITTSDRIASTPRVPFAFC